MTKLSNRRREAIPRHQHHHHHGYGTAFHEDVVVMCQPCHVKEHPSCKQQK